MIFHAYSQRCLEKKGLFPTYLPYYFDSSNPQRDCFYYIIHFYVTQPTLPESMNSKLLTLMTEDAVFMTEAHPVLER